MKMPYQMKMLSVVSALVTCFMSGCASEPAGQNTADSAATGAVLGAAAGMVIGNNADGLTRTEGAIGGAVIGAVVGGAMGNQADQQARHDAAVDSRVSAAEAAANTTVVNISNANGSVTPVTLQKSGNQWMGPKGELYNSIPTEAQLKPVYGLDSK